MAAVRWAHANPERSPADRGFVLVARTLTRQGGRVGNGTMHIRPIGAVSISVGVVLALSGSLSVFVSPVHAADRTQIGWTTVPAETASGQNFILNSVAAPTTGAVWVAGYHWEVVGRQRPHSPRANLG